MTLIETVRQARRNNHNWIAIDKTSQMYSYEDEPLQINISNAWELAKDSEYRHIGHYNLTCDWKKSLIDVNRITVQ